MEIRKGTAFHITIRPAPIFATFYFLFSVFLMASGCGAPGEPVPPVPPVPVAIKDLAAHQADDGVQLPFTLPTSSVPGDRLSDPPPVKTLTAPPNPTRSTDAPP